jgi:hypothetical protein
MGGEIAAIGGYIYRRNSYKPAKQRTYFFFFVTKIATIALVILGVGHGSVNSARGSSFSEAWLGRAFLRSIVGFTISFVLSL